MFYFRIKKLQQRTKVILSQKDLINKSENMHYISIKKAENSIKSKNMIFSKVYNEEFFLSYFLNPNVLMKMKINLEINV